MAWSSFTGPRTPLTRHTAMKRTAIKAKRRNSDDYGGPKAGAFRASIRERDDNTCQWCRNPGCLPLHVHHLQRVGMGGSKTANRHDNAITLGADCHRDHHDGQAPTRVQLRDRMLNLGHLVLLTNDELDGYDEWTSKFDGRKGDAA